MTAASPRISDILSPQSPTMSSAVFGSAPRPRRPSTPRTPPAALASQPSTPKHAEKTLPPVPAGGAQPLRLSKSASGPGSSRMQSKKAFPTQQPPRQRGEKRSDSPDVEAMMARTPRPRRKSSATFAPAMPRTRSNSSMAAPSSWRGPATPAKSTIKESPADDAESVISDYGTLLEKGEDSEEEDKDGDGSESDSSIDIHTPLPHLMFRDGLLSPRSKLLPGGGSATLSLYLEDDEPLPGGRATSVLSLNSTAGSTMTKSGIHRDPRDTERRRVRHRDQQLLRAGMGLTTGLGWSDSEDEDAPSLLTRRLITTNIARQPSTAAPRAPSKLSKSSSIGSLPHAPTSFSPISRPSTRALSRSASTSFSRLSTVETESITSIELPGPARGRTQSNASASSIVSSGSRDSSAHQSVASSQNTAARAAVPRPLRLPLTAGVQTASAITRSASASATESRPPVSSSAKLANAGAAARARTRTHSNPGPRPAHIPTYVPSRAAPSKIVPPRSVSSSVMAPVRAQTPSSATTPTHERSRSSLDPLGAFPLPPAGAATGYSPPTVRASPVTGRVLNTVGTGPRPGRPRTGTGMAYRTSSYASYYEAPRPVSGRTSVVS